MNKEKLLQDIADLGLPTFHTYRHGLAVFVMPDTHGVGPGPDDVVFTLDDKSDKWLREGRINGRKIGQLWRIPESEISRLLGENE